MAYLIAGLIAIPTILIGSVVLVMIGIGQVADMMARGEYGDDYDKR